MSEQQPIPTTEKLAQALELANAPTDMVARARAGYYDDFKSHHPTPIVLLVEDCQRLGLTDIAQRAMDEEFDATKEESEAWANSSEGQEILQHFGLQPPQHQSIGPFYCTRRRSKKAGKRR